MVTTKLLIPAVHIKLRAFMNVTEIKKECIN